MTTPTRYGTSCAPREDGVFVHFTEYEKVVAECERLRIAAHDIFAAAALAGILAHPTTYRDIALQAECDQSVPGEVALERAFEWADRVMDKRNERAKEKA
jgi:hypothetical protein